MEYRIVVNGVATQWKGTISECLYNLAHRYASHNTWKTVTMGQCIIAGAKIVKA